MSTELVTKHNVSVFKQTFTFEQIELIKSSICKNATDDELKYFLHVAQKTGLDPFTRQIYSIRRWDSQQDKWVRSIQTSIDGFRVIAERSDKYAGQVGPFWCGEDGKWQDTWLYSKPPVASKVGVLRHDFKEIMWGFARYSTFEQKTKEGKTTKFWATMPEIMIAKVAESIALRKAFPQDLSGLYTGDEMTDDYPSVITPISDVKELEGNGVVAQDSFEYRFPSGPHAQQTIQDVFNKHGVDKIIQLLDKAEEQEEKLPGRSKSRTQFIIEATQFLKQYEDDIQRKMNEDRGITL